MIELLNMDCMEYLKTVPDKIKEKDVVLSLAFVYYTQKPALEEGPLWQKNTRKQKRGTSDLQKMMMAGYEWNIVWFGKNIMEKFRSVCKSITRIITKQTMIFPICNLSRPLDTSGCTLVADLSMENGKSRALYVASIRLAIKIIGIFRAAGLTGGSVKNASSKNHLQQERFLSQRVGSVKIIREKTRI